ncbi:MAG TPA: Fic family protein [Candidatus Kapabacteria bacterium]|nr:Fic family protein [Candidatus Kapabacteria bacterium]
MDIKAFKAGTYRQQTEYKSFSPNPINEEWIITDPKLVELHSAADRKLGELAAAGRWIDDIDFFISMHIAKEATTSSRIEGTQTTMEEAMAPAEEINPERRDDWREVQNYIVAINGAIRRLGTLPLSNRLLKETHETLLAGVRGRHKHPGEWRKSQNWLGSSLKNAVFVPPSNEEIPHLMSDLEKFLMNEKIAVPPLVRIALAHYQFETVHPFLDGNGRLGRLLISLYLVNERILEKPTLYLSDFFERNRTEYYDRLTRVRTRDDLEGWLRFFFAGVIETAEHSIRTLEKIVVLRRRIETVLLPKLGHRAEKGALLLKHLYARPVVSHTREVEKACVLSASTANRLLGDFIKLGILREKTGYRRNRRFAFEEYLGIFKNEE